MLKSSIFLKLLFIFIVTFSVLYADAISPESRGEILGHDGNAIILSPVNGYLINDGTAERKGAKGLQRYYDKRLVRSTSLPAAIHSTLQKRTENILDEMKAELNATEVLAAVMHSSTGELFIAASSSRYNSLYIMQRDISGLNQKFSEYLFELGSVMKPITAAIALEEGVVNLDTPFNTYQGKLQVGEGRYIIDHGDLGKEINLEDIIVHSSNIGISQVSWKMTGEAFRNGLLSFGFGEKSGIDLSRDLSGTIKSVDKLEHKMHRANTAYGYGMLSTFTQMLKAYSAFVNDGMMVAPHIATIETYSSQKAISFKTANEMKKILIEVVQRGTGKNAKVDGLIIGGKTGTAHIAENGKYTDKYNSTFFGFAEDKSGNSYTIGVLVIEAKEDQKYFASRSAAPTFKKIVDEMVKENLLVIDTNDTNENIHIYNGEKTISPLPGGKLDKAFGIYTDKTYNIKIFNESISIKAAKKNAKVQNVLEGKVVFSGKSKMLGNVVVMAHKERIHTVYAGLSKISPDIAVGKLLKKGVVLGHVEDKLMFQVTQSDKHVNPLDLVEL